MSQANTPVIKPYTGKLQDQDEKGSLSLGPAGVFAASRKA
jgi:hypothetical protein